MAHPQDHWRVIPLVWRWRQSNANYKITSLKENNRKGETYEGVAEEVILIKSLFSRLRIFGYVWHAAATLKMPHEHDDSCGNEHDHDSSEALGFQDNLFTHIDRPNVVVLNANGNAQDVIKPWHTRLDESQVRCMAIHKPTLPI